MEANKCLVTQLYADFEDNNLDFFDGFVFDVTLDSHSSASNVELAIGGLNGYTSKPFDIEILGDGNFINADGNNVGKLVKSNEAVSVVKKYNEPYECYVSLFKSTLGKYKILVHDKYNIIGIGMSGYGGILVDIDKLKYCDYLIYLAVNSSNFKTNNAIGELSSLEDKEYLREVKMAYTSVTGDIYSLSKSILLENLWINDTAISGSIESLAVAQISNGRTSGSISVRAKNTKITYQGELIASDTITITFSNGSYSVS